MRRALVVCALVAVGALQLGARDALADMTCRSVETTFEPVPHVQMAVWVEDAAGNYVDTLYVTRLTGSLGLANRPGLGTWKSNYRWPYGARSMVMPVWAHKRNHTYGELVMGGSSMGVDSTDCGASCRNDTIGYHYDVSSPEPFYCGPSGGTGGLGLDATSCASGFFGSKGAYLSGSVSYYPPRADLTSFLDGHDAAAAHAFAMVNDLGAVSSATPPGNALVDPPVRWTPPGDGAYVLKVEVSKEYDFNTYHEHPPTADGSVELRGYGLQDTSGAQFGQTGFKYGDGGFGQPSIVYAVPFTVGAADDIETTSTYIGYGDWDGATGTMHAPDLTITDSVDGTGVGRLLLASDAAGSWRVKVTASASCGNMEMTDAGMMTCVASAPPTDLLLAANPTSIDVSFASDTSGTPPARFDVRYRQDTPITSADFLTALPPSTPAPAPGAPGSTVSMSITGLRPQQTYHVAVRALSSCGAASSLTTAETTTTQQKFVTLTGCFIATAAYGTPMAQELDSLRHLRDRHLLTNPLGRVFVAGYYAVSPPLARAISGSDRLRAGARALIEPLLELSRKLDTP